MLQTLVESVKRSLSCIIQVLDLIERKAGSMEISYAFLIHNSSITAWRAARLLQKEGYRNHAMVPCQRITEMMQHLGTDGHIDNEWMLYNLMSTCILADKEGDNTNANKMATEAVVLARSHFDDLVASTNEDCRRSTTSNAYRLQCLANALLIYTTRSINGQHGQSKGFKNGDAVGILQSIRSGHITSPLEVKDKLEKVLEILVKDKSTDPSLLDLDKLDLIGEISRVSYDNSCYLLSRKCVEAAMVGRSLALRKSWILAEVTNTQLKLHQEASKLLSLEHQLAWVLRLDQSVIYATQLNDVLVLEEVVRAVWNESMGLLQNGARTTLRGLLKHSADALAAKQSMQMKLRVQLHFELAQCEFEAGFISKANKELKTAMSLDYTLPLDEHTQLAIKDAEAAATTLFLEFASKQKSFVAPVDIDWLDTIHRRPLDKYMKQFERRLRVRAKSGLDYMTTSSDSFQLLAEKASDAKPLLSRKKIISKAILLMKQYSEALQYLSNCSNVSDQNIVSKTTAMAKIGLSIPLKVEEQRDAIQTLAHLWNNFCKQSWECGLYDLADECANESLRFVWSCKCGGADLLVEQAEAHIIKARICHVRLIELGVRASAQLQHLNQSDIADAINHHELTLLKSIQATIDIGISISHSSLVICAISILWNSHQYILQELFRTHSRQFNHKSSPNEGVSNFTSSLPIEFVDTLQSSLDALQNIEDLTAANARVLIGTAIALSLENSGDIEQACVVANRIMNENNLPLQKKRELICLLQRTRIDIVLDNSESSRSDDTQQILNDKIFKAIALIEHSSLQALEGSVRRCSLTKAIALLLEICKSAVAQVESNEEEHSIVQCDDLSTRHHALVLELLLLALKQAHELHLPNMAIAGAQAAKILIDDAKLTTCSTTTGQISGYLKMQSLIEVLCGMTILNMIHTSASPLSTNVLERIHLAAAEHAVIASTLASQIQNDGVCLRAAHLFWNASHCLLSSSSSHHLIASSLEVVVNQLEPFVRKQKSDALDVNFRVILYTALLEYLSKFSKWTCALSLSERMLQLLPSVVSNDIRKLRAQCLIRLKKSSTKQIKAVREESKEIQAFVLVKLARQSMETLVSAQCYSDVLSLHGNHVSSVPIIVEFAEWQHAECNKSIAAIEHLKEALHTFDNAFSQIEQFAELRLALDCTKGVTSTKSVMNSSTLAYTSASTLVPSSATKQLVSSLLFTIRRVQLLGALSHITSCENAQIALDFALMARSTVCWFWKFQVAEIMSQRKRQRITTDNDSTNDDPAEKDIQFCSAKLDEDVLWTQTHISDYILEDIALQSSLIFDTYREEFAYLVRVGLPRLCGILCRTGLAIKCVPIMQFSIFAAKYCIKQPDTLTLIRLRLKVLLRRLSVQQNHVDEVVGIDGVEIVVNPSPIPYRIPDAIIALQDTTQSSDDVLNGESYTKKENELDTNVKRERRNTWLDTCIVLLNEGRIADANKLNNWCAQDSRSYEDENTLRKSAIISSEIAVLNGQISSASSCAILAHTSAQMTWDWWIFGVSSICRMLYLQRHYDDIFSVIKQAEMVFGDAGVKNLVPLYHLQAQWHLHKSNKRKLLAPLLAVNTSDGNSTANVNAYMDHDNEAALNLYKMIDKVSTKAGDWVNAVSARVLCACLLGQKTTIDNDALSHNNNISENIALLHEAQHAIKKTLSLKRPAPSPQSLHCELNQILYKSYESEANLLLQYSHSHNNESESENEKEILLPMIEQLLITDEERNARIISAQKLREEKLQRAIEAGNHALNACDSLESKLKARAILAIAQIEVDRLNGNINVENEWTKSIEKTNISTQENNSAMTTESDGYNDDIAKDTKSEHQLDSVNLAESVLSEAIALSDYDVVIKISSQLLRVYSRGNVQKATHMLILQQTARLSQTTEALLESSARPNSKLRILLCRFYSIPACNKQDEATGGATLTNSSNECSRSLLERALKDNIDTGMRSNINISTSLSTLADAIPNGMRIIVLSAIDSHVYVAGFDNALDRLDIYRVHNGANVINKASQEMMNIVSTMKQAMISSNYNESSQCAIDLSHQTCLLLQTLDATFGDVLTNLLDSTVSNDESTQHVVFVCDIEFQQLPWEGVKALHSSSVSVSRDFSVTMLYARLMRNASLNEHDSSQQVSIKAAATSFVSNPSQSQVDDTHKEALATPTSIMSASNVPGVKAWSVWTSGRDKLPISGSQWQKQLVEHDAVLVLSWRHWAVSLGDASHICALSLPHTRLVHLADQGYSTDSFKDECKRDLQSANTLCAVDTTISTTLLLSLCGVITLVVNRHAITANANILAFQEIYTDILNENHYVGNALHKLHSKAMAHRDLNTTTKEHDIEAKYQCDLLQTLAPIAFGLAGLTRII